MDRSSICPPACLVCSLAGQQDQITNSGVSRKFFLSVMADVPGDLAVVILKMEIPRIEVVIVVIVGLTPHFMHI